MKYQPTAFSRNILNIINRLDIWSSNPWRKYSLLIIIFLFAFFIGSSIGMINGALSLMDPVGAFFTVILIEIFIRFRKLESNTKEVSSISRSIIDSFRMGLVYGLFMEGFKLF